MTHEEFQEFKDGILYYMDRMEETLYDIVKPRSPKEVATYRQPKVVYKVYKDVLVDFIGYAYENLYGYHWAKEKVKRKGKKLYELYVHDDSEEWFFKFLVDEKENLVGCSEIGFRDWDIWHFKDTTYIDKTAIKLEINQSIRIEDEEVSKQRAKSYTRRRQRS